MMNIQVRMPRPHRDQAKVKREAKRFNVANCGRRFGKTVMGMELIVEPILAGQPAAYFSPTYKMLSDVWREMKLMLQPVTQKVSEQEHRIELITGGVLDMWSLDDPNSARGRHYKRVVIDEAAMIRYLETAWTHVIRPTLADLEGDAYFFSTPKGLNYFYTLYQMRDADPDKWAHWKFPTSSNPFIKKTEIEEMRRMLPSRVFMQEILAEFISDGSYFQNVDGAAIVEKPSTPDQHSGHYVVCGIDFALSEDFTVLAVGCRDCNTIVDWERFNQIDFTYQRERIYSMADRWHVAGILPERNSIGEPNIELIMERVNVFRGPDDGRGFNTTATSKPPLIEGLANALEHHNFKVPMEAADELRAYQIEMSTAGHPKFAAPSGLHDDWVIALALCWRAMTQSPWFYTKGDEQ
jgi:hypothetical protein